MHKLTSLNDHLLYRAIFQKQYPNSHIRLSSLKQFHPYLCTFSVTKAAEEANRLPRLSDYSSSDSDSDSSSSPSFFTVRVIEMTLTSSPVRMTITPWLARPQTRICSSATTSVRRFFHRNMPVRCAVRFGNISSTAFLRPTHVSAFTSKWTPA